MRLQFKDYLLVGLQGVLFIAFIINVPLLNLALPFYLKLVGLVISILGFATIAISILQLNKNLSPFPTPKSNSKLIQTGLYKYSRHPIYTGILLACSGYAVFDTSIYKIVITLMLLVLFIIKSNYEEERLTQIFKDYPLYKKRTGRFFPKLF